jgi:TonB family protein
LCGEQEFSMIRVSSVRVFRPAVLAIAACAVFAAVPATGAAAGQLPQQNVTVPAERVNQLLRGGLVDAFEQALVTQRPLETLLKEQQAKPADMRIPLQIAAYYSQQNDTAKTIEYLSLPSTMQPDNPETCCLVASYLFGVVAQTARQEERLTPENVARASQQVDRALQAQPQHLSALLYKTMLLVLQAGTEKDPARQATLVQEAGAVRARFSQLALADGTASPPEKTIPISGPSMPNVPNAVRAGGNIPLPVRTVYVEPVYPEDARQAGIDGMVILEALIGEDGKVMDARIMRSIPALDAAALAAVRQWAFAPTVINGVAQKVIMSVTVSFPPKAPEGR